MDGGTRGDCVINFPVLRIDAVAINNSSAQEQCALLLLPAALCECEWERGGGGGGGGVAVASSGIYLWAENKLAGKSWPFLL